MSYNIIIHVLWLCQAHVFLFFFSFGHWSKRFESPLENSHTEIKYRSDETQGNQPTKIIIKETVT